MARNFPSKIPFWITVVGVPTEYWSTQTFQSIGNAIEETTDVDLDYSNVRVVLDGFKELFLETTVDFTGGEFYEGEEVPVRLSSTTNYSVIATYAQAYATMKIFVL